MSTESTERRTTTVPPSNDKGENRSLWPIDDRATVALRELQEGELLQLTINYSEDEIQFINSYKQTSPDSVGGYFATPSPQTFSFYRYPESGDVVLIWTRPHWPNYTKQIHAQNGLRRDLAAIAKREGIKAVHTLQVSAQKDITGDSLREAISSPAT